MITHLQDDDQSSRSGGAIKIVRATALSGDSGWMCAYVDICPLLSVSLIETHVCASIATTTPRACVYFSYIFACLDLAKSAVPMFRVGRTTDGPALGLTSRRPPPLHRLLFSTILQSLSFLSIPCTRELRVGILCARFDHPHHLHSHPRLYPHQRTTGYIKVHPCAHF